VGTSLASAGSVILKKGERRGGDSQDQAVQKRNEGQVAYWQWTISIQRQTMCVGGDCDLAYAAGDLQASRLTGGENDASARAWYLGNQCEGLASEWMRRPRGQWLRLFKLRCDGPLPQVSSSRLSIRICLPRNLQYDKVNSFYTEATWMSR